ncbi:MAG: hypothetical protein JO319_08705 [Acidobacteriaceae bacterium]|nr:hypothetical protein [Acidobacteriaceae bacterium]
MKVVTVLALAMYGALSRPAPDEQWMLVRSAHFEVYSQAGEHEGRSAALWLEQLRSFFAKVLPASAEMNLEKNGPLRLIEFGSAKEYAAFQPRSTADAYFATGEGSNYIVMSKLSARELATTAHEYTHFVLHSMEMQLAPSLAEGLAELFSTIRISADGCFVGGDLPARSMILRQRRWIPMHDLLTLDPKALERDQVEMFYAESWALADMLVFSPAYASHFSQLWNQSAAASSPELLYRALGKPAAAIMADLHTWVQKPKQIVALAPVRAADQILQVSLVPDFESRLMLAELLLASDDLERSAVAYTALAASGPADSRVAAALGSIALRKNDKGTAREQFKRAVQLGTKDAGLCYRYAILAEDAGASTDEIAGALRRAIEARPDFDDARYKLGLLESNAGHFKNALEQFRSMRAVPAARAFAYWTAVASALNETDQRQEAKDAAKQALSYAATPEERASALRLAYIADTDLTVQLSRDSKGNFRMVTARKTHGSDDWNPFIEPTDKIRSFTGRIETVECSSGKITGFRIASTSASIEVALPDPAHVLIAGGSPEFVCGGADGRNVVIQYAEYENHTGAQGILRGMHFQ